MFRWTEPLRQKATAGSRLALCGACGALAVWPILPQPTPAENPPAAVPGLQAPLNLPTAEAADLAQLREDNQQVKRQLLELQQQLARALQAQTVTAVKPHSPQPELPVDDFAEASVAEAEFALLEEQFYAAPLNADETAAMQRELNTIVARLEHFTGAGTYIQYQECRSNGCRIEFVHEGAAPTLLPALIASQQHSRVRLSAAVEDGQHKTIALYQH